ncbi:MAG TPA: cupin [Puia sp.]
MPVLLYKNVLKLPFLFPGNFIRKIFERNSSSNAWKGGIFTYHHYHSNTHKALGIYRDKTKIKLGGEMGSVMEIQKGDVLIIPAGVAHKNLGNENQIGVIGAYPGGKNYDIKCRRKVERQQAEINIQNVLLPSTDPVWGAFLGVVKIWNNGLDK